MTGSRFGRLQVLHRAADHISSSGKRRPKWVCACDCGTVLEVLGQSLHAGNTSSCGCLQRERAAEKMAAVGRGNRKPGRVSYSAAHRRVRAVKGSARLQPCVDCGATARQWSYDHADQNEWYEPHPRTGRDVAYSTDPDHYAARCLPCHTAFDKGR